MGQTIRVLLLADTHLGFDLPQRPRVDRRRRGDDFFANFDRALQPALDSEVDLVVHGGDVFFRSRVSPDLVLRAFAPLKAVADSGVPVVVVPGNHERSAIPYPLLAAHPRIHVFHAPRTVALRLRGADVAVAGFPCVRRDIAARFSDLVERTGWNAAPGSTRLLCIHQTVEGATVGPVGYVFRNRDDVIRGREIPRGFAAVLAGHIHRHQVLTRDLSGRLLAAPVFYPGSIDRTSSAERDETKGFIVLEIDPDAAEGGRVVSWEFRALPSRPMVDLELATDVSGNVERRLRQRLSELPPDSIVRVYFGGSPGTRSFPLTLEQVRAMAPPTMNIEVGRRRRDGSVGPSAGLAF